MHSWDMGVNLIDLGVILYLYSPIGRTTLKWEAVVEPWTQVILGWKDIVILIYLFFDLKTQILYFIAIQNEWHHHQPHC